MKREDSNSQSPVVARYIRNGGIRNIQSLSSQHLSLIHI